jgi:hypothetical protein
MDLLRRADNLVPVLYGLLIMGHSRRQILWFGVTAHPTAEWIANQFTEACGWEQIPRYLIRDRDRAYGEIFVRRGFGTRLLRSALTSFDGKTEVAYLKSGVHCTIQCRIPQS